MSRTREENEEILETILKRQLTQIDVSREVYLSI
jgi:hypothetical protein